MCPVSSLVDLLQQRASDDADRIAFTYAERGVQVSIALSYGQTHALALAHAARLREHIEPGQRVLLLFPAGLEFIVAFFASLYAGAIPVPCYPPARRAIDWTRLAGIDADCEASAALTTAGLVAQLAGALAPIAAARGADLPVLGVQLVMNAGGASLQSVSSVLPALPTPDDLAFLQYTSGSTGQPKGVMVSHANVLANVRAIHQRFGHSRDSQGLIWLPAHHDMGLIGGVFAPLYGGFPVQSPLRWLQAVASVRATTSGGPNFAFARVLQRVARDDLAGLDLGSWQVAFSGAESVDADVIDAFCELLQPARFSRTAILPCYGLAESTLLVAAAPRMRGPRCYSVSRSALAADRFEGSAASGLAHRYVTCGPANDVDELLIVDASTRVPCPERIVGEIWVRGPSVARGYWSKPDLTAATFAALLADGRGPYLRTKDRGCLCDGELVVTGRAADMLIVRGKNHYAEDIEAAARRARPGFQDATCAVFGTDELSDSFVLVMELARTHTAELGIGGTTDAVREHVCETIGVAPAEVRFVSPGSIPRTTSGKVQRRRCRELYLTGHFSALAAERSKALDT
jgi:acyl-CoA synthetase (AMP-forming)/AMP-acid ligase II